MNTISLCEFPKILKIKKVLLLCLMIFYMGDSLYTIYWVIEGLSDCLNCKIKVKLLNASMT